MQAKEDGDSDCGRCGGAKKMMTHDYAECPNCKHKKALTHYSSCGMVNWIACPKCRKFFEHGVEKKPEKDDPNEQEFWDNVIRDTGWSGKDD